ncbi:sugar ABC transporter substrate-binding protein [Ruminococcus gauvreauii]|uniref:Sugar ABC transporter substrate-binding protein n=1 Tax=Ruminococcus gauvreauii TaxID=438033 RepID=A0ABY5VKL3_9FIRM|nr:sugar ABC transporter substrate-binding protein [Ruminococcus gauvreauii]UWP60766.1 sugar ABC transporter substrate-binding protein [Ruminococcus gauvreauii]
MKKMIALLLALLLGFSCMACSAEKAPAGDDAAKTDQPEETPKTEDDKNADEQKKADGGDSGVDAASGEKLTIGFATKGMFSPFFGKMEVAAKEYCQEKGIELVFQAPDVETNVTRQIEILENFIVSGVDAIVFAPCDDIMLNSTIKKANDAGIPVVLTNDTLNDEDLEAQGGSYYSYVGTAQYDAGKLGGEWLAKKFPEGGQIATLGLVEGVSAGVDRVNGFMDQLPDTFEYVSHQPADAERSKAYNVTQDFLTAYPDLKFVFAACDEMALGAVEAIEEAGKSGEIIVVGLDGNDDAVEAVEAGRLSATIVQDPAGMATTALDTAIAVLNGEEVEKTIYTPCTMAISPELAD